MRLLRNENSLANKNKTNTCDKCFLVPLCVNQVSAIGLANTEDTLHQSDYILNACFVVHVFARPMVHGTSGYFFFTFVSPVLVTDICLVKPRPRVETFGQI